MNCDRIAPWYRWFEYIGFGRELERRRFAFLPEVSNARRILVLGDGDGRFLKRLVECARGAQVDYLDSSAAMLQRAQRNAGDRATYLHADALVAELPAGTYDLIVTHFFLDCFDRPDAERLVARIVRSARPESRWLISEFRQQANGWQAVWGWIWLRTLYLFFGVTTGLKTRQLVDHHPLLAQAGYRIEHAESARFGLLSSELWTRVRQ